MNEVFICEALRTPFGRYGGALSSVRADDLGAIVLKASLERNSAIDPMEITDVIFGCANQAGEDNRNVARMSALLAGFPVDVPGVTLNRLCGSGMDAIATAARVIASGEGGILLAGGVESMSRAPYVLSKAATAFARDSQMYDTTIGWRFINPLMKQLYGTDSMPETGENVAEDFKISREDQDRFSLRSQQRALAAQTSGWFDDEIVPVTLNGKKGSLLQVTQDEHPRETTLELLSKLPAPFRAGGTITAGNSSGVNDGACALILANEATARRFNLVPKARILGSAVAGVPPRIMGIGPVAATRKLIARLKLNLTDFHLLELNEAFASQALATLRELAIPDDAPYVNAQGGAIALGHPLGASGARLITTAVHQLKRTGGKRALCSMCIGVGQGISMAIERV